MKKILCIILACLMIAACFAFVSCTKSEEKKADAASDDAGETKKETIAGKWEMEMSGDMFSAAFGAESGTFTGSVKGYITFGEDGKYVSEVDEDSYNSFMKNNLHTICEAMGFSVQDMMTLAGVSTEDELLELMLSQDENTESMDETGEYTFEDGVLTMKDSGGGESKIKAELNGNSLVWKEIISEEDGTALANESIMPLTLTRVG